MYDDLPSPDGYSTKPFCTCRSKIVFSCAQAYAPAVAYICYISEDLQVSTKIVGLRLQLLDYLSDSDGARIELERYQRVMNDFFMKALPGKHYSAAELMHMVFPYTEENRDYWYQLRLDMKPKLAALESDACEHVYIVSLEGDEDGEE